MARSSTRFRLRSSRRWLPPECGVSPGSDPGWRSRRGPVWLAVAVLVTTGLAFDVLGIMAFRASRTTVNPLKPERASALVTGGVYRITRNPMYVGMVFLLLAWAVYLSAVLPFAGIVVFIVYITRFQIQPEERVLTGIFGDEYSTYAARVRRWL